MDFISCTQLADELREDLECGVVLETEEINTYLKEIKEFEKSLCSFVDCGAVNKIIEGYCVLAAKDIELSDESIDDLKNAIRFKLDFQSAKFICEEYDKYRLQKSEV